MGFNVVNIFLEQPRFLIIIGSMLLCMIIGDECKNDKKDKSKTENVEEESAAQEKYPDRIAFVKEEFVRLGLQKISDAVRELAARSIVGEIELSKIAQDGHSAEVETLVGLYQETKFVEFLRNDFDKLSVNDKLQWLKNTV